MVEVVATSEFRGWFVALEKGDQRAVDFVVELLRDQGLALGAPYSSAIAGASFALRELRPKQGRSPLRVLYAFDPDRQAVLILGGDKGSDKRFYRRAVVSAKEIWARYVAGQAPAKKEKP